METPPFPGCQAGNGPNDPFNLSNVHGHHVAHSANYLALDQPTYATLSSHGSPQKLTGKSELDSNLIITDSGEQKTK